MIAEPFVADATFQMLASSTIKRYLRVAREIAEHAGLAVAVRTTPEVASQSLDRACTLWNAVSSADTRIPEEFELGLLLVGLSDGRYEPAEALLLQIASSPDVLTAALAAGKTGVLDGVYPTANGRVVAAVSSFQAPPADGYAAKADDLRNQMLYESRVAFLDAWTKDLVAHARVNQKYEP